MFFIYFGQLKKRFTDKKFCRANIKYFKCI